MSILRQSEEVAFLLLVIQFAQSDLLYPNRSIEREVKTVSRKKKRNASGMGSIRHRPDGNWEARYTEGVHPDTGKQIRKSIYGKTQKEVRQALTKKLYELDTKNGAIHSKCHITSRIVSINTLCTDMYLRVRGKS